MRLTANVKPTVIVLGPSLSAMSGVSAHLNQLFASAAAREFSLRHFQIGSEGREENLGARLLRFAFSPLALAGAILRHRAAVVHLNTALNARAYWRDLAYTLVARLCGARVICQVHGGALPEHFFGRRSAPRAFLRATLRLPHALLVLARCEQASYRRFVPRRQTLLLPNGVACPVEAPPARPPRAKGAPLRLLYIGRLALEKGLYETLQAVRDARAAGVPVLLTIGGGGPQEQGLRAFAAELGIERHVTFAGPVFGAAKERLLAEADALVLASYAEGLPYALLESMAAGVPAIATPVGAIPDVVQHGVHGLLVAPADPDAIAQAITELAADPEWTARLGQAAHRRIAEGYTSERMAQSLCRLYRRLCSSDRLQPCPGAVDSKARDRENTL